jgi:2-amino-4-hydroxy-6-hydroxymethyldihydropteridine diphosphokinase
MTEALIGLGANLGERARTMRRGLWSLGLPVAAVSSLYESLPVETEISQPSYLNAVAAVLVPPGMAARELLDRMLAVEASLGRVRGPGKPPRTLDLDLLLFGAESRDESGLILPHPGLLRRRFVLEPLLEVRPGVRLPDGRGLGPYLAASLDQAVRLAEGRCWWWRIAD